MLYQETHQAREGQECNILESLCQEAVSQRHSQSSGDFQLSGRGQQQEQQHSQQHNQHSQHGQHQHGQHQ